ncbi:hypothetical protein BHE74_00024256 [Ensete ventricosum]|nr:hypothetical protein BHE74_00024256 [Ensete ventricosum]RZR78148.1 hypothetical protein BHM03_00003398 [Ensete ventricosum]
MESPEEAKAPNKECVKVAVNVRPLITTELLMGCTDCVTVVPGEPQVLIWRNLSFTFSISGFCFVVLSHRRNRTVQIGSHAFTFDHVYGSSGSSYSSIFKECVLPLIDALFHGYNATVLAYGQIFKEEVFDLLDPQSHAAMRTEGAPIAKPTLSRAPIQIRETAAGGITLAGVTEAEVRSKEEMASYLTRGSISRATGSTNMNSQSRHEMITFSCISPADSNAEETINTLKYANRARNIQNKAMLLQHKISLLEASNAELRQELKERQVTCELLKQSALDAQLTLKIESARGGKSWDEIDKMEKNKAEMKQFTRVDTTVLKQHYEKKLLELEQEKKLLTVSELKKKQDAQAQLLRQKQKSDEAAKRLQEEIQRIKSQKVTFA